MSVIASIRKLVKIKRQPIEWISSKCPPDVSFGTGLLYHNDCLKVLKQMPDHCIDTVITDSPYALEFMGKQFDTFKGRDFDVAFCHWFAGFVDGEGCFSVHKKLIKRKHKSYETYDCQFSITIRDDDATILYTIQKELGIGTVRPAKAGSSPGANPKMRYCVSSQQECLILRDVLRSCPLRAKKAMDFEIWSEALDAWLKHEYGKDWKNVAEARDRLMQNKHYKKHGVSLTPYQMWTYRWAKECLRVIKPGGILLSFGGTRTFHRLTCAIEDAGWEIRDCMMWLHGQGFPKSANISKQIDKAAGVEREVVGVKPGHEEFAGRKTKGHIDFKNGTDGFDRPWLHDDIAREHYHEATAPATDEAKLFDGYGTALKPAWEPIILAMKPIDGTYAENALKHGVSGINVDGGRVGTDSVRTQERSDAKHKQSNSLGAAWSGDVDDSLHVGRFPANVIWSHHPECVQVGMKKVKGSGWAESGSKESENRAMSGPNYEREPKPDAFVDEDGLETVEDWKCHPGCPSQQFPDSKGQQGDLVGHDSERQSPNGCYGKMGAAVDHLKRDDSGSASRFFQSFPPDTSRMFYCAKAGASERGDYNNHPTLKPLRLMEYLCKLTKTPTGGVVLDPFLGSGTTALACVNTGRMFVGIEQDQASFEIAVRRLG